MKKFKSINAIVTVTTNDISLENTMYLTITRDYIMDSLFSLRLNGFPGVTLNEIELYEILLGKQDLSLCYEDYKNVRIIEYKTSFPILYGYRGPTYKNLTLKELLESIDNYRDWIYYDNKYIFDCSSLSGEFKTDIPSLRDMCFLNVSSSEHSWWFPGSKDVNSDLRCILGGLTGIDLVTCMIALRRIINITGELWIKS